MFFLVRRISTSSLHAPGCLNIETISSGDKLVFSQQRFINAGFSEISIPCSMMRFFKFEPDSPGANNSKRSRTTSVCLDNSVFRSFFDGIGLPSTPGVRPLILSC